VSDVTDEGKKAGSAVRAKAPRSGSAEALAATARATWAKSVAAWFSIGANVLLIVFKLIVGFMSGSIGIISEALHSSTDLLAAVIALISVRRAARPADPTHHFGHEKVENVSGVVEGLLIWMAAVVIVVEAVRHLIIGEHLDHIGVAIGVMLISAAINAGLAIYLYPVARRTESVALRADAAHHLTDVYTSLGVALGLVLAQATHKTYFDPILAIAVALIIMWTAWQIVSESTRVLLDETLPEEDLAIVRATVAEHRGELIVGYHKLRSRRAGSRRHIDLHITVDETLSVGQAHAISEHISDDITAALPNADVLVHIEPAEHDREDGS
jgi:cation diffusion facilitator family transporter